MSEEKKNYEKRIEFLRGEVHRLNAKNDRLQKELDNRISKDKIKKEIIDLWKAIEKTNDDNNFKVTKRSAFLFCINKLKQIANIYIDFEKDFENLDKKE